MARFDVHQRKDRERGYLLDCQADLLSDLNTRLTVPLLPPDRAPTRAAPLNPSFTINGEAYVMVSQFASAVALTSLGKRVDHLGDQAETIIGALDLLITGV